MSAQRRTGAPITLRSAHQHPEALRNAKGRPETLRSIHTLRKVHSWSLEGLSRATPVMLYSHAYPMRDFYDLNTQYEIPTKSTVTTKNVRSPAMRPQGRWLGIFHGPQLSRLLILEPYLSQREMSGNILNFELF